ncbi:MAG: ABC transporter substrate-binding protein [Muribaculaceae bacterium]
MRNLVIILLILIYSASDLVAQKIIFSPQWTAQSQFAGYYAAKAMGYYRDAGLTVDITYPAISENPFDMLKSGASNIVTINLMQALAYRKEGHRLVNVMQTSHKSSLLIVSHFAMNGMASFEKKKLGIWCYINSELVDIISEKYKLNMEFIRFNSGVNLFLSKAIDATIASSYDELIQLRECGFRVNSSNVLTATSLGLDIPEEGVYVTEEYYNANKEVVRKFVNASIKGWLWVRNHQAETIAIVLQETCRNKVPANAYHQRHMLKDILRLQNYHQGDNQAFILKESEFNMTKKIIFPTLDNGQKIKYSDFVRK